jgi:hypothetical protein
MRCCAATSSRADTTTWNKAGAQPPGVRRDRRALPFAGYYGDLPAVNSPPTAAVGPRRSAAGTGAGFRYENWLFESHPGWEVNATLYLPADLPPPYPPIVVPVGHSGKQFAAYQRPCQYFARAGLAALVFDPPGVAGEKQRGNDHFCDGVRCHLTGDTSSRYFVGDALRAMDFLGTRADIDRSHGFTLTGVSGGGNTSVFAALLDERASRSSGPRAASRGRAGSCSMPLLRSLPGDPHARPPARRHGRPATCYAALAPRPCC